MQTVPLPKGLSKDLPKGLPKGLRKGLYVLGSFLCAGLLFTALVGFAHTRAGRPLLGMLRRAVGQPASCPLGFDVAQSPAERQAGRRRFAATHSGPLAAQTRPALGFALDQTTRAQVAAWAAENGIRCVKPRMGSDLDCADVPAKLFPASYAKAPVQALWLSFGADDKLVSVITVRRERSAETISAAFRAVAEGLAKEAGPPSSRDQDDSPSFLTAGLLRQASAEYRFRDYYALARETNMGDGFVLTEEYRSLVN